MKKKIHTPLFIYTLTMITFLTTFQFQSDACTVPTTLMLNYTFTEVTAGQTVEVTWVSDCPAAMMSITLINVDLWQNQQTVYNIPNTGSYMFAINSNLPTGQSGFYIEDVGKNIWNYGPYFELLAPLPVELTDFNGKLEKDNLVLLTWNTESEVNNEGFEIEHSENGHKWNNLDFITGKGTSLEVNHYEFIHRFPSTGNNYYRLKQVDFDGSSNYSNVVHVFVEKIAHIIRISPNPTAGDIHVFLDKPAEKIQRIDLFDLEGKLLRSVDLAGGINKVTIEGTSLPPGMYFLKVTENEQTIWVDRVIKQ